MNQINAFDKKTWNEAEEFYFGEVEALLQQKVNVKFSNGRPYHAVFLIEKFFRHARRHMRIFSGSLTRQTEYGMGLYQDTHVIEAAKRFLEHPERKLTIVLEKDIDVDKGMSAQQHPLIEGVCSHLEQVPTKGGELRVFQAHPSVLKFLDQRQFLHHLIVMDHQAWRIETDAEKFKAQVNTGDSKGAGKLAEMFDVVLCSNATQLVPVPIP